MKKKEKAWVIWKAVSPLKYCFAPVAGLTWPTVLILLLVVLIQELTDSASLKKESSSQHCTCV